MDGTQSQAGFRGAGQDALLDPTSRAQLVARVAERFMALAPEHYGEGIEWALAAVGEFTGADRSYCFELDEQRLSMSNTFEWCAPGIAPEQANLQDVPTATFPWFEARCLRAGAVVCVPRLADLPPEAAAEKAEWTREGICSLLCVPLESAGEVVGFLGLDTVHREVPWSERAVELLRSVGGMIVGALNHRRARLELTESEQNLRAAQHAGDIGMWSWDIRRNRVRLSEHAMGIYGIDPATFGGRFEDCLAHVHPDDVKTLIEVQTRAFEQKRGIPVEFRVLRGDDVRRVRAEAEMFLDAAGEPRRMTGMIQDITGQRAAEKSQAQLSMAITQVADAVMILNAACTIEYVNPAFERATGFTRTEAVGQPCSFLHDPSQPDAFWQSLHDTMHAGEVWVGRMSLRRKGGGTVLMDSTISPVQAGDGGTANFVAVQRDITREAEIEEQLRQVQKMEAVGMLAGGIAHDFNNLLIAIIGHSDLLLMRTADGPDVRRHAEEIRKAGDRAKALTSQLLAFSRKQVLRPRVLDLNAVIEELGGLLQRVIGEDIELSVAPSGEPATILADPGQMEQVVMNLATNARDAMPEGGALLLSVDTLSLGAEEAARHASLRPGAHVLLTVRDSGEGMDEATQSRIFEPFFTTKAMGKGTGLGLATVYGITRQSGGAIEVESRPEHGTTLRVLRPRVTRPAEDAPAPPSMRAPAEGTEIILVVEDEPSVAAIVRSTLRSHGYTVLYAENGRRALDLMDTRESPIDLLFTDVVMPE
ncbi:MAG: PAS domain S-box protein, partial [Planctomycetota bacterium]|nr:PAS domain S-box protein [Planctomycetota bacterium]